MGRQPIKNVVRSNNSLVCWRWRLKIFFNFNQWQQTSNRNRKGWNWTNHIRPFFKVVLWFVDIFLAFKRPWINWSLWKFSKADVKSDLGIELNDYRWHQVCVSCSGATCQTVLDNKPVDNLDTDNLIEPLAGNYRKLVIGDFDFGGKVQDLEFGFGKTEQNLR